MKRQASFVDSESYYSYTKQLFGSPFKSKGEGMSQFDLVKLFVEFMTLKQAEHQVTIEDDASINLLEIRRRQQLCLRVMAEMYDPHDAFDNATYSRLIRTVLGAMTQTKHLCARVTSVLADYCFFQCMVVNLGEIPSAAQKLEEYGLTEWAALVPDRETLRPFAEEVVSELSRRISQGISFLGGDWRELAELLDSASYLYEIVLPPGVQAVVVHHLGDDTFSSSESVAATPPKYLN